MTNHIILNYVVHINDKAGDILATAVLDYLGFIEMHNKLVVFSHPHNPN